MEEYRDEMQSENRLGFVRISEDVVAKLAAKAAMATVGVAELTGGITESLSKNILGKTSPTKGIKIALCEEEVESDLYVIVRYGVKIPEVAWNLQENVKKEIEESTGYKVKAINVHVQGVSFTDEE